MPTINEYQSKRGYYIRAWTPNTSNITYKIREEGNRIVESYGLCHEDEISWDTIKTLKALRLIYTDGSGTLVDDGFEPDPDQVKETSLSEAEAERLLSIIREHRQLSSEEVEDVCSILGIDPPLLDVEKIRGGLTALLPDQIQREGFPTKETLNGVAPDDIETFADAVDVSDKIENGLLGVTIGLSAGDPLDEETPTVAHWVFVCQEHGIENWNVSGVEEETWAAKGEICRQKGHLIGLVANLLDAIGIDPGNPRDSPAPEFRDMSEWVQ
jgi:hypothetical protein